MPLVYGIHAVTEALEAAASRIERVSVERGARSARVREIVELARSRGVPVSFEERAWLDRKCGGARHQGVACAVGEIDTRSVEELVERAASPGLFLVLDGVTDPHNVGAILRSAEAAGADGVLLPRRRSASMTPAAVKASAGAAAHVPVARFTNTAQLLDLLKKNGYWIAGLAAGSGQPLWKADFTLATALVVGDEHAGMHRLVRDRCDFLLEIPMRGKIGSYNVSVAAGIVLYEVQRQRIAKRGG
jgi:23S rRNA (guanosine2251-2'-O)-methyltransferase